MNESVAIRNLHFSYPRYHNSRTSKLFTDAGATFQKGMMHVLLGRPETGKTTLGRILCGLTPDYSGGSIDGSVLVEGVNVVEETGSNLIEYVGMVFQDPEEQILMAQVEDEIVFPLESLGLNRPKIHERLERELSFWDLDELRLTNPGYLSGGEKKRLLLAALCAVNPKIWILDETFEELDEQWREALIQRAVESGNTVIVLASKHIELYDIYASSWSVIHEGKIVQGERSRILQILGDNWEYRKLHPTLPYIRGAGMKRGEPIISLRNISYSYPEGNPDFTLYVDSLDIFSGQITAFYGPNGSGKSTLSKILCGLIRPDRGEITVPGKHGKRHAAAPSLLQRFTGYLFQNPDYQIFLPSVKEELMFSLLQAGVDRQDANRQALASAELFGLTNLREPPAMMSYGARKRLQAAVCYLLDRSCCILDEADSGLLMSEYIRIIDLFVKRDASLIIITHDLRLARKLADTIVTFQDGRAQELSHD